LLNKALYKISQSKMLEYFLEIYVHVHTLNFCMHIHVMVSS
jgi:hypothetical protein